MSKEYECCFCNSSRITKSIIDGRKEYMECPVCGKANYLIDNTLIRHKNEIACYLFYNKNKFYPHESIIDIDLYDENADTPQGEHNVTYNEISSFYNCSFAEKIDKILLNIAKRTSYLGGEAKYSQDEILSLFFVKRFDADNVLFDAEIINHQKNFFESFLFQNNYIGQSYYDSNDDYCIVLTADGWKRVDELQKSNSNNQDVFVSMAFNDSTKATRDAISKGIVEGGFSAEFLDEIIHNRQIIPEMFRLIRECRFLILDISEPNYGAYYEAGYALGLGKEVIITCNSDVFNRKYGDYTEEELRKFEKYLKPHFDIAQKQILIWDNYDDLTKKLKEWIKALF